MESIKVVIISEDTSIRVNLKKKLADRDIQIENRWIISGSSYCWC